MDAHRRTFIHARQGVALPALPFDPLDPFGIKPKPSSASSASASSSSASASASASASITPSASASESVSASASLSSSSASSSSASSTPSPSPTPDSPAAPSSLTPGPPSTQTVFTTVNPTPSSTGDSTLASSLPDTVKPTGFLQNKVLSGIVFGVIGLIGLTLIIFIATWFLRRRRNKRLVNEAISFDPVNFGKDDYSDDHMEKGRIDGAAAGAGAALGAVGAPATVSNSGHDARSMKSVGSYATGSASHGAPPLSQAPPFADYIPPVPYLNSAPPTPRAQHGFSEQQNQMHNTPNGGMYNAYRGSGYGQPAPSQQPAYAPPYYTAQGGVPPQQPNGYDYGNATGPVEGEYERRSSSSMELKFASPGTGRR